MWTKLRCDFFTMLLFFVSTKDRNQSKREKVIEKIIYFCVMLYGTVLVHYGI